MAIANINRFITLFDGAFRGLSADVSMAESERLAMLVQFAMDSKNRVYHNSLHVFGLCEGMNPHQILAALFHDVVYFQLDGGFPEPMLEWLKDVAQTTNGAQILQSIDPHDKALSLCAALFDFTPGQALPLYGGMNEFLSAVVAARLLQSSLSLHDLIAVVACIEAAIPFRLTCMDGISSADRLAERVDQQCQKWLPTLDTAARHAFVSRTVCDAVLLANRDVGGFAHAEPGLFLSSTWLLIDESNAPLTRVGVYSLRQYRDALMRMEGFLGMLNPESIFQSYQTTPTPEDLAVMAAKAANNIAFACDFLDAKIASVAIIEALSLSTGTDCPVAMFLGDIRSAYGRPDRVEDFLPEAPISSHVRADLLEVFEKGRTLASNNELTASPLTAFVYRHLGDAGTRQALRYARDMFAGILTAPEFLEKLNRSMVSAIIHACARIALSRADALRKLDQRLQLH
jgi:hypothetical protein